MEKDTSLKAAWEDYKALFRKDAPLDAWKAVVVSVRLLFHHSLVKFYFLLFPMLFFLFLLLNIERFAE